MTLKVAYNDDSQSLIDKLKELIPKYPLVKLETYHEGLFKERKKSFKVRGAYSARHTPFAVLIDNDSNPVRAFYSEANECVLDNIINVLNNVTGYGSKGDSDDEEESTEQFSR